MSDPRTDFIANALRRADYMNWSAAEVAEKIDGTVESVAKNAVAADRSRLAGQVRALPEMVDTDGVECVGGVDRAAVLRLIEGPA